MATAIQWRRGTTSQHSSFTGLVGEITVDTDLDTIRVHDGSTAGGHRLAKFSDIQAGDITAVTAGSSLSGGGTSGAVSLAFDGSAVAQHILPSADVTYDLGSSSKQWRDLYVGPGSLYVNGQKVIEDNSGTIQLSADANQNVGIITSGSGDVELNASGTGVINLQSAITVDSGQVLTGTGGLTMGSNININSNSINNLPAPAQANDAARKAYVDGATYLTGGSGIDISGATLTADSTVVRTTGDQTVGGAKTFSSDVVISGDLTVNGTNTIVNTTTASLADNIVELNRDASGSPSENAGLQVNRGSSADVFLQWNETSDVWQFTNDGTTYYSIATGTDALAEGSTNLYFTNARADARIAAADTDALSEGSSNLYHTSARADARFDVKIAAADTDSLSEGSSNLYYTNARADARIALQVGTNLDISNQDTGDLAEGSNLYYTNERVDDRVGAIMSGSGNISVTYDDSAGTITIAEALTTTDITEGDNQYFTTARARAALSASGDISYNSSTGVISFTNDAGDIEGVTAGSGLTGGGTSGAVTLNIGAGTGITVNADDVAVNMGAFDTDNLSEGSTNLYYTNARADARITGYTGAMTSLAGNVTTTANVAASFFVGTATAARYADLAEKYESDAEYEAGTVVCFGGESEVTACGEELDHRVAGVISTDPAYMMNADAEGQYVALTGRVPCKVVGPVAKGDLMVASGVEGHAKADNNAGPGRIIGKAIGSIDSGEGVIEVLVNMM